MEGYFDRYEGIRAQGDLDKYWMCLYGIQNYLELRMVRESV